MESNLFKYILRYSWREQLFILALVLLSQVPYYLSLDLPKTIVNGPIQGKGFDTSEATARFLRIRFEIPEFIVAAPVGRVQPVPVRYRALVREELRDARTIHIFDGFKMGRVSYLLALSLTFFVLVLINGAFKLHINTLKGRMGERMLRRLRYELFDRVLRFPLAHFRKVKQAEIATMIKDEVEPLGGFIGDAFVQPAFLGGQALTALVFILTQSVYLGLVTVGVLVLQLAIIPPLRKPVLRLGRERQLTARQLAGRIAECVDGVSVIHVHDTSNFERADIVDRLGLIFDIRFRLYQLKFAVKFLNNLLAQLTPFLFYLVGGYLAITGRLDVGGLVAVIAAYKDLPGPIKELLDWYQQLQDVQIKYEQVVEQFQPEGMLPSEAQALDIDTSQPLAGEIVAANLVVVDESDRKLLDGVALSFKTTEHVAVTGEGRETLALALAGLVRPSGGSLKIGSRDMADLPEAVIGRRISYVGSDSYLFPVSVRDNLVYGLKHRPLREAAAEDADRRKRKLMIVEAQRAGNPPLDPKADWIDYDEAGASDAQDLLRQLLDVIAIVDLDNDVYQLGLRGTINPNNRKDLAAEVLKARRALHERLADPSLAVLVEPFDRSRYNKNLSLEENLLFGTPVGDRLRFSKNPPPSSRGWRDRVLGMLGLRAEPMSANAYLKATLDSVDATVPLLSMGRRIAETMVELFADLPPGHPFFEQFSFIDADDLPEFRALLARIEKTDVAALGREDRIKLIALSLPYVEARHRLDLIDEAMEQRVLAARRAFAENLPPELAGAVEFYDEARYNSASTLQDNILFGRLVYGQAQAGERVGRLIAEVLESLGLRRAVLEVGLDFQVGIAGKRLSSAQRQKVDLARALVKRPDLLILNEATALLDAAAQTKVMESILAERRGKSVIWITDRPALARKFDRVLVMRDGRFVEEQMAAAQ
ncbi:MAG TPA: ABC transporter transmembrane domain-containing protein [Candidatus Acidoferrum sp.]|nr:ABC transporter transmembrane domain-containing protein [Candidatus Acidoferrum sp.]